ncbi:MAG: hypothetical protein CVV02_12415 [Firmicutes bacterium HGW-Firmicutes-7]|nr:MAG: hypothetical protein CVV02_12415 [Firmicutes bacterium HGW-Firmicutes-7]
MVFEQFFIICFLIVIVSCTVRIIWRNIKRKSYGKKLLTVRDVTSNIDVFFGILFLLSGLITLVLFLSNSDYLDMIFLAWPIYLSILSPIYLIKAFTKIEMFEEGILTRDGLWKWDIAEAYSLKEERNTAIFSFNLNRRFFNSRKIVVLIKNKDKVENTLKEIFQL